MKSTINSREYDKSFGDERAYRDFLFRLHRQQAEKHLDSDPIAAAQRELPLLGGLRLQKLEELAYWALEQIAKCPPNSPCSPLPNFVSTPSRARPPEFLDSFGKNNLSVFYSVTTWASECLECSSFHTPDEVAGLSRLVETWPINAGHTSDRSRAKSVERLQRQLEIGSARPLTYCSRTKPRERETLQNRVIEAHFKEVHHYWSADPRTRAAIEKELTESIEWQNRRTRQTTVDRAKHLISPWWKEWMNAAKTLPPLKSATATEWFEVIWLKISAEYQGKPHEAPSNWYLSPQIDLREIQSAKSKATDSKRRSLQRLNNKDGDGLSWREADKRARRAKKFCQRDIKTTLSRAFVTLLNTHLSVRKPPAKRISRK